MGDISMQLSKASKRLDDSNNTRSSKVDQVRLHLRPAVNGSDDHIVMTIIGQAVQLLFEIINGRTLSRIRDMAAARADDMLLDYSVLVNRLPGDTINHRACV